MLCLDLVFVCFCTCKYYLEYCLPQFWIKHFTKCMYNAQSALKEKTAMSFLWLYKVYLVILHALNTDALLLQ